MIVEPMIAFAWRPLLAADLMESLIGILFFIFWIAVQFLSSRQEAKRKQPRPRPKPQPQPQQRPIDLAEAARKPQHQEEALRSEVEDFLRRAEGRPQQRPAERGRQMPMPEAAKKRPAPVKPLRRQLQQQRSEAFAELEETGAGRPLRQEGVAEHVARHISTQEISQHTATLGSTVALADDRLESRLHEKFDHELGSLQHRDTGDQAAKQRENVAADIASMLASPNGMRQLIVANEILRRPEW